MLILKKQQEQKEVIKVSILYIFSIVIIVLVTNVGFYKYLWYEHKYQNLIRVESQHDLIKSLIISHLYVFDDDQQENTDNKVLKLKDYVKDNILFPKASLSTNRYSSCYLTYITLQEMLNVISEQNFIYNIKFNEYHIINNGNIEASSSITRKYLVNKNLVCTIELNINPNSLYEEQAITKINRQMLWFMLGSGIIFILVIRGIIYLFNRDKKIKELLERLRSNLHENIQRSNDILLFHKVNEEFILKCYQYSKNSMYKNFLGRVELNHNIEQKHNNEYFPLAIESLEEKKENSFKVELNSVILDIRNYFKGYTACYNSNIILNIENTVDHLVVPFEQEIFNQIVISILSNILYFNKDAENRRYVKIIFQENMLVYSSNGFRLDKNLAIRYSEKIFNNTANLYILNLGQIFLLLKDFQINHSVIRKDDQTIIEIKIDSVISKQNDINAQQAKVIQLDKLRNNRKQNDQ